MTVRWRILSAWLVLAPSIVLRLATEQYIGSSVVSIAAAVDVALKSGGGKA